MCARKIERGCRVRLILFYLNKIVCLQVYSCSCFIQHQDACFPKTRQILSSFQPNPVHFRVEQSVDFDIFINFLFFMLILLGLFPLKEELFMHL
jgi:hypothetical protein